MTPERQMQRIKDCALLMTDSACEAAFSTAETALAAALMVNSARKVPGIMTQIIVMAQIGETQK